jgi:hypothetical protein
MSKEHSPKLRVIESAMHINAFCKAHHLKGVKILSEFATIASVVHTGEARLGSRMIKTATRTTETVRHGCKVAKTPKTRQIISITASTACRNQNHLNSGL